KLHYEILYGKDHYNVNEMEDYINKFENLTPARLEEIMMNKIKRYGYEDIKAKKSLETYTMQLKNRAKSLEEARAFFDIIYQNFIQMLKTFNKEELYQNPENKLDVPISDFSNWVENIVDGLKEINE